MICEQVQCPYCKNLFTVFGWLPWRSQGYCTLACTPDERERKKKVKEKRPVKEIK